MSDELDIYVLDWLLMKLPQDKIWLDTFEKRLRKLGRMKLVEKTGDRWILTKKGRVLAKIQEGSLPKQNEHR